jgi:MFS family permease
LIGFALEPVRAALLAFTNGYAFLVLGQLLNGISGATITVLTVPVITDLTTGTGRFNLAEGAVGAAMGIAASASTIATGFFLPGLWQRQRLPRDCHSRLRGNCAHSCCTQTY